MKTAFILAFILLLLSFHSNAQQTIDKLNVNQLKLPKESANKALILDGAGQVKSSSTITDTELGYLEGLSDTLVNLLSGKANDSDVVKLSGNQSVDGIKTFTGKLVASSTVNGSIPCPVMTEAQRDLFTPVEGDCVYNSDTLKLNVFDGSVWKDVGGAGGISLWLTANPYNVNDIVIESDKIYRCLIAHTSGTFATDLAASKWGEVSQGLTSPVGLVDGGTGVAIAPVAGSIVYVDADSFEQTGAGSVGQVIKSNGTSAPTWSNPNIYAKSENGSPVTAEELQVSNNQLTQVDTNKHLIESGNNNLLINPSFEHQLFSTGWTNSVGTFTEETVVEIHGKKAAKLVLSSQTMSLTQSSTLYAAQFADGVQGLVSVRVKSNVALKVCSIQAGTVSTTNCVDVQANNKWGLYKVPFILGATSNGISIASTGAVSGTVYIDDAFVGAASLTQNMNACNDPSCETEFSASVTTAPAATNENMDFISTCTGTSTKTCNFNANIFTVAPNCTATQSGSGNFGETRVDSVSATTVVVTTFNSSGTGINSPFYLNCQKQGADFTAAKQLSNGNTYSSTNADTDWASCGHTAASFTGFGTVSAIETQCKRQGSDLLMKGKFTSGVPTAVEARLNLPIWNGVQLVSSGSSKIPSLQMVGTMTSNTSSQPAYYTNLIETLVNYMTFGVSITGSSGLVKQNGNIVAINGMIFSFNARIPIEGWENSNIIIGQFNGLESCSSTLDCTDTFSASVTSTGTVVAGSENVDWINGNCTFGTGYVCNYNTGIFTATPNCTVTASDSTGGLSLLNASSSTSVNPIFISRTDGGATNVATPFRIICQKAGADYIGKTAKAVASDQNIRTPGVTKAVFYSAGLTSAGVPLIEIGDFLNGSCTCATGAFSCSFNTNTWATTPSCQITNPSTRDRTILYPTETTSSLSFTVQNTAGTGICEAVKISCHGVSP